MAKFRKKPIVIEAVQWPAEEAFRWLCAAEGQEIYQVTQKGGVYIETLEGKMLANRGDWIIKGVKGEIYPCKPDIFEKTYEQYDGIKHLGAKEK